MGIKRSVEFVGGDALKCDLCGLVFNEDQAVQSCQACPLLRGCKLLRCPRCGYETLREPGIIRWVRRRLSAREAALDGASPATPMPIQRLSELRPGMQARVVGLEPGTDSRVRCLKLIAMGIYPGALIDVIRRRPALIFRSGYSRFAIDEELAGLVRVEQAGDEEATGDGVCRAEQAAQAGEANSDKAAVG